MENWVLMYFLVASHQESCCFDLYPSPWSAFKNRNEHSNPCSVGSMRSKTFSQNSETLWGRNKNVLIFTSEEYICWSSVM